MIGNFSAKGGDGRIRLPCSATCILEEEIQQGGKGHDRRLMAIVMKSSHCFYPFPKPQQFMWEFGDVLYIITTYNRKVL